MFGAMIMCSLGLIWGLIIYLMFDKLQFGLDYENKFEFSPKIMGLTIPIETWVQLGVSLKKKLPI